MEGVYRVLASRYDGNGQRHDRLLGRFAIYEGMLIHLEDHGGVMDTMLPAGMVTARTKMRLQGLERSGYYKVIPESEINEGHHPNHLERLDVGQAEPDSVFTLAGEGMPVPKVVEVWSDAVEVDGKRLADNEVHEMMDKVRAGTLILTPVS
jgi:hypothetical protein